MSLVPGGACVVDNPDSMPLVCGGLQQNWTDGVDDALALAVEVLLIAGW
jgi:hypothetical protein